MHKERGGVCPTQVLSMLDYGGRSALRLLANVLSLLRDGRGYDKVVELLPWLC